MPHFHWKKKGENSSEMIQVQDSLEPTPEQLALKEPATATATKDPKPIKVECIACDPPKGFRTVGMMSMHFGKAHPDLKEDKDSFREYMLEKE